MKAKPCVIMVAPALSVKGGISHGLRYLLRSPLTERYRVIHISTHVDGSALKKIVVFALGLARFLVYAPSARAGVVHVHFSADASFWRKSIIARAAKFFGKKLILHAHTSRFDLFLDKLPGVLQAYVRQTLRRADRFLALSPVWAEFWSQLVPGSRVRVLPNAVPLGHYAGLRKAGRADERPLVVTLARLCRNKGTYDTLAAAPEVIDRVPEALFLLAGDGDLERVRGIVRQNGLTANFEIQDWVDEAERDRLYARAWAFLLPSYREGVPYGLLEAMASGLAVVTTAVGGIPEVAHGAAVLVDPGRPGDLAAGLIAVLTDPARRGTLGRAAQQRIAERYDSQKVGLRLAEIYDEVTGLGRT
ncbi:MAG: glycosyltransferase family 4 protein [Proteobacteria bacterium]|nr:glycosyltransferase family 4 protein [Pseudomonadota bacterium]